MAQVTTKWCVFSGAPSSGKTSLLSALAAAGMRIVPETARVLIESELAKGAILADLRKDPFKFQTGLLAKKIEVEERLPPEQRLFLDRALPDSVAYFELYGLDSTPVFRSCAQFRYDKIFLFDRLPLEDDHIRVENESAAEFLHKRITEVYLELDYKPIQVPVTSVENRVKFILEQLN